MRTGIWKICFALLMLVAPYAQAINRVGDADNSGGLNAADAAQIQSYLYGLLAPSQISPLALADADADLDLADLMWVGQASQGLVNLTGPGAFIDLYFLGRTIFADGEPPHLVTYYVDSLHSTATMTDGLEISVYFLSASGESTLTSASTFVSGGTATAIFTPVNPADPTDLYVVEAWIYIRDAANNATVEEWWESIPFQVTAPYCGDGVINGAEICDDGFVSDCGLCNIDCTGPGSGFVCGDGLQCDGEACDDGNTIDCDGCKGDCSEIETDCPGAVCDGTAASPACWLDSQCAPPTCFDGPGDCYEAVCAGYDPGAEVITWSNKAMVGTLNGWTDNSTVGSSMANDSGGAPTSDYSPRNGGTYVIPFTTQTLTDLFRVCVAASRIDVGGGPVRNVTLQTSVDGSPLFNRTFNVDDSWSWSCSGSFSLDAGPHTLEFDCLNASGKSRCAIDGVVIRSQYAPFTPPSSPEYLPYETADWDDPALDLMGPDVLGRCDAFNLAPITCGDGLTCGWEACDDGANNFTCGDFFAGDCMNCEHRAECGGTNDSTMVAGWGCSTDGRIEPPGCINLSNFFYCDTSVAGTPGCPNGGTCFMGDVGDCIVDLNVGCCYGADFSEYYCAPGNPCDYGAQECEYTDCYDPILGGCIPGGMEPDGAPCGPPPTECIIADYCMWGSCMDGGVAPFGSPCSTCGSPPCFCDGGGTCIP